MKLNPFISNLFSIGNQNNSFLQPRGRLNKVNLRVIWRLKIKSLEQINCFFHLSEITKACLIILLLILKNFSCKSQDCKSLNEEAEKLSASGNKKDALKFQEKAYLICKTLGDSNLDYATCLNNLAYYYCDNGLSLSKAIDFAVESLNIKKKALGDMNIEYLNGLKTIGYVYGQKSDYKTAIHYYKKAFDIGISLYADTNIVNIRTLSSLGALYAVNTEYTISDSILKKIVEIRLKRDGSGSLNYANALYNLAYLNSKMDDLKGAEILYIECSDIYKSLNSNDNYLKALNGLSTIYSTMGDKLKAKSISEKIFSNKILNNDTLSISFSIVIDNLANLEREIGGNKLRQLELIQKSLEIKRKIVGELHPEFARALENLADYYYYNGDYKKAEPLYLQVIEIRIKVLGEEHPDYARALENLAYLYVAMFDYKKAESHFSQSLEIQKNILGEKHSDYINSLGNLALLFTSMGDYKKAEPLFLNCFSNKSKYLRNSLSYLSTSQAVIYFKKESHKNEIWYSSIVLNPISALKDSLINFNYFIKGALLQNFTRLSNSANNSIEITVQNDLAKYKNLKTQITKLYQQPKDKQINLKAIQEEADKLEKQLMQQLPSFQEQVKNNNIQWQQVQATLANDEAAIEFVNFQYHNKHWTDTTFYAAYIVKKGITHPIFINCFQEKDLIAILDKPNTNSGINTIYRGVKVLNAIYSSQQYALYNLIWAPIDSSLQGIKRIYLSPSGLLHRVAFAAITTPENKKLLEQYELHIMSNTRALAESKSVKTNNSSMALLGGIDYEQQAANNLNSNTEEIETLADFKLASLRGGTQEKWNFLAGTKSEAAQLKKAMATTNMSTTLYTGSQASEELLKAMGTGKIAVPNILHIATHGFALPIPEVVHKDNDRMMMDATNTPSFSTSEDPLTRAGLVLAGANKMWTTGKPYTNREDGILTAREIAELDLRNCNLAVLSACETGLGELKGNEGVFGLQRAFKMAGVHNLIISLWSVPDAETSEFMQLFYNNWLQNKMEIHSGFTATQMEMSAKYDVYKWAAFVLVE